MQASASPEPQPRRKPLWWRLLAAGLVILVVGSVGGCAIYSGVVQERAATWEAGQTYNQDGVRQGFEDYTLGEGRTALLMVHGFGDTPEVWRPMAETLAREGFRCRAIRLPGFGDRMAARQQVGVEDWVSKVASEAEALQKTSDEVWVLGHSLGAAVVIRATLDSRLDAGGLILLAPLVKVGKERSPVLPARQWFRLLSRFIPVTETPYPPDIREPLPEDYPEHERFISRNIYRALFDLLDANRPQAGEVKVPLLMAVSPHDRVADEAAAQAWFDQAVNASPRKLVRCENSAHVLPRDHDAEMLARQILLFLRGVDEPKKENGTTNEHE